MSSPFTRIAAIVFALLLIGAGVSVRQVFAAPTVSKTTDLMITASAIQFAHFPDKPLTKGSISFVDGQKLTGSIRAFGGLSAMLVDFDKGTLTALSDQGQWLHANIQFDDQGLLAGFDNARMSPMLDEKGKRFRGKNWRDAESITRLGDQTYVGLERHHRIVPYRGGKAGPFMVLPGSDLLKPNGGFEAIAALGDGRLLAISEYPPNLADHAGVWLWQAGSEAQAVRKELVLAGDFHPTDMALLANGDILMLERFFQPAIGPQMRLRLLTQDQLDEENGPIDAPVLATFGSGYVVDNMEAIAIAPPAADGSQLIHILSDDNFNRLQQTLWLTFRYHPEQ